MTHPTSGNGGGNLSDVYDFYCITGGPFSC